MPRRDSSVTRECYHLDTNYLINYLTHRYASTDLSRTASQVINQQLQRGTTVKISVLAGGEFLKVVTEKFASQFLDDLAGFIQQGTFAVCIVEEPHLSEIGTLVTQIRQKDNRIEPMDVMLVAHSMIDAECKGFLTFERKIIDSVGLKEIIDESRRYRNRFKIVAVP